MASRELNLDDAAATKLWHVTFKVRARAKKWQDQENQREIADNFIACCGLKALAMVVNIVSPKKLEEMEFKDVCTEI